MPHRLTAFRTHFTRSDRIRACRALAASRADAAAREAEPRERQPQHRSVEHHVDREAGPEWRVRQKAHRIQAAEFRQIIQRYSTPSVPTQGGDEIAIRCDFCW